MEEFKKELELLIKKRNKREIDHRFYIDIYSGRVGIAIIPSIEIDYVNKIKYQNESGCSVPYYNLIIRFKWLVYSYSLLIKYGRTN